MNDKKNVTLSVNPELWALSKDILPYNRSEFFERCLEDFIGSTDEIADLKKEIENLEIELKNKKLKLEHLENKKKINSEDKAVINKAMETVQRIVKEHGSITNQQIEHIANNNQLSKYVLTKEIHENKLKIVKIGEVRGLKEGDKIVGMMR